MTYSRLKILSPCGQEFFEIVDEKTLPFYIKNFLAYGYQLLALEILKEVDLTQPKNL